MGKQVGIAILFVCVAIMAASCSSPKDMVKVPGGEFTMGNEAGVANEKPAHKVQLSTFYIDKFEVTNEQYAKCVAAKKCTENQKKDEFNGPKQPVIGVDWNQANTYCKWAKKRLPTEAEWEKAARGTDERPYPHGKDIFCTKAVISDVGSYHCGSFDRTSEVGSKPEGASPYGALDMAGNVMEWVADWYDEGYYAKSPKKNPKGPDSGKTRIMRGGSWYHNEFLAFTYGRLEVHPNGASDTSGFRCAK